MATLGNVVTELRGFKPRRDGPDSIWEFYIPFKSRWQYLHIQEYKGIYYFSGSEWDSFSTEKERELDPKAEPFIRALPAILRKVHREITKDQMAYNLRISRRASPHLRLGIIPRVFVRELIPEWMRYDQELSAAEIKKTISILSTYSNPEVEEMTSGRFFEYCKIAYLANGKRTFPEMNLKDSGLKLYDRWADGRDGGLRKLDLKSPAAFERWYEGGAGSGGHPWEIYRGGNSTHIDLAVSRSNDGKKWKVGIGAFSSTRLVEACRIMLALNKAGLPFECFDQKSYLHRLAGDDWVGIVPKDESIKYAWQQFPEEWHVADCIHFSWFKDDFGKVVRPLREIRSLITWFPLPPIILEKSQVQNMQ